MTGFEVAVLATTIIVGIGCFTGIVLTTINKIFDRRLRGANDELARARDRIRMLEARVVDLQIHNEHLVRTHDWTNRLLDAQEAGRLPAPPLR
jgi:hypothetical protein